MPKRYQISTTISPYTWYQVHRLATEYGTIREVIARGVELLEAQHNRNEITRQAMEAAHDYNQRLEIASKNARRRIAVLAGVAISRVRLVTGTDQADSVPKFIDIYAGSDRFGKIAVADVIDQAHGLSPNNPEVIEDGSERPLSYMTGDLAPELYDIK